MREADRSIPSIQIPEQRQLLFACQRQRFRVRPRIFPGAFPDCRPIDRLISAFDDHMAEKRRAAADTEVNRLRAEILAYVRAGSGKPTGLFTLTVPTGGGKTLASLAFALDHAKRHGQRFDLEPVGALSRARGPNLADGFRLLQENAIVHADPLSTWEFMLEVGPGGAGFLSSRH
jgi:hypothetical protein